jgi:hypothetical protein
MRECETDLKRAMHYETCLETCLDTSVSCNMSQRVWRCLKELVSQYQLVSRQVAVSRRSPYTMIPCNWDWGKYLRVWGGLETSNSLAASLFWITTKWIPISSLWRNLLIFIVCTLRRYQSVCPLDTSLMKPRYRDRSRDKSHSVWPALQRSNGKASIAPHFLPLPMG